MNKKLLVCYTVFLCCINLLYGQQVGINTNDPNPLTVLDIQNATKEDGNINPQGVMVPRLTEEQRNSIDVSDAETANSLLIYNTDEDCFNFYSRTEKKWRSLCGESTGMAIVTSANCDSLIISGNYQEGVSLNNSNYLRIPVVVSRSGSYELSAVSNPGNGYFFHSAGTFLAAGSSTLIVQGLGTPVSAQTDNIIVTINGVEFCSKAVNVTSSETVPIYTLDCSSPTILGRYIAGTALSSDQHMVELTLTCNASELGSVYEIKTEIVNGYSYYAKGVISQTTQKVALYASGTPLSPGTDTFIVSTNSGGAFGVTDCSFDIKVATKPVTIVGVGENATYYLGVSSNGMNRVLSNQSLFGPNQTSTYPVGGFNIIKPGVGNDINLSNIITNSNPDIIIIQYNWIGGVYGASNLTALTQFVNNGGVLILCSDGDGASAARNVRCTNIIRNVFDTSSTTDFVSTAADAVNIQPLATESESPDNPVLSGPFKNLYGLNMSRDAGNNFSYTNLTSDASVVAWGSSTRTTARAFMHKTKGFLFIGDGAPFAYAYNNTEAYNYSMKLDSNNNPIVNTYGSEDTYNSFLFCNIMAWAIDYIVNNGSAR